MAANSRDVEAVVCDRCFFMDFDFVCSGEGEQKQYLTQ